jgi:hypothetical protein
MAKKRPIILQGRHADTSCAVCGRPLTLWDATTTVDGATVCATNCLGAGIERARQLPEFQGEAPTPPDAEACGSWYDDLPE